MLLARYIARLGHTANYFDNRSWQMPNVSSRKIVNAKCQRLRKGKCQMSGGVALRANTQMSNVKMSELAKDLQSFAKFCKSFAKFCKVLQKSCKIPSGVVVLKMSNHCKTIAKRDLAEKSSFSNSFSKIVKSMSNRCQIDLTSI